MSDKLCHECGATTGIMASASRGEQTRQFCHNEVRDCYNIRRGRYFEEVQRNPYKGIRKVRKAQWVYECRTCKVTSPTAVDLSTASLYKLRHERGMNHAVAVMETAVNAVADAFTAMLKPVNDVLKVIAESSAFAPAPNRPHDPSLLKDKRKWGGR